MQSISVVEKLSEELSPTPLRVLGPDSVNLCQSQVFPILPTNFWVYQLTFPKQRRWSFGTKMPEIGVSWMSSHVIPPFTNTVCKYSNINECASMFCPWCSTSMQCFQKKIQVCNGYNGFSRPSSDLERHGRHVPVVSQPRGSARSSWSRWNP